MTTEASPAPTDDEYDPDEVVLPALLRSARGPYAQAIREKLAEAGFELPRNGPFLIGGMANHAGPVMALSRELGVSKQATSQLIDTLVEGGYLTREVSADDRRRVTVTLTERGFAAGAAIRAAVQSIDARLAAMITPTELAGLRAGLFALAEIKDQMKAERAVTS